MTETVKTPQEAEFDRQYEKGAAAGAVDGKKAGEVTADLAKKAVAMGETVVDAVKDAAGNVADTGKKEFNQLKSSGLAVKENAEGAMSKFNPGSLLGGLVGLLGAYFLGGIFGSGFISTALTIGLAVPMFLMGSNGLADTFNGWMGVKRPSSNHGVDVKYDAQGHAIAQDAGKAVGARPLTPEALANLGYTKAALDQQIDQALKENKPAQYLVMRQNAGLKSATPEISAPTADSTMGGFIPVAVMQEHLASCKLTTGEAVVHFGEVTNDGRVPMTCALPPIAAASRSR